LRVAKKHHRSLLRFMAALALRLTVVLCVCLLILPIQRRDFWKGT
jgi:hypothetical protein